MSNYSKINIGDKFGLLTVIEDLGFFKKEGAKAKKHWYLCQCSCSEKTIKIVESDTLKRGTTKSCGCLAKKNLEKGRQRHKHNEYYIYNDIVFVKFTNCDEYFICDLDCFDNIKNRTWYKDLHGYAVSDNKPHRCRLNRFIMNPTNEQYVDHINGYLNDYRKNNLRNVYPQESSYNIGIRNNNTSGYKGVYKNKKDGKYEVYINANKKRINLGRFADIDEAIKVRKDAEIKYFGNYRRVV